MPIICGGTNYYIESLIWKILIEDETKSTKVPLSIKKPKLDKSGVMSTRDNDEEQDEPHTKEIHENTEKIISNANSYDNMSNVDLHCELRKVDKERANDLHMNERRKVIRSLEVYNKHNRPHSEILQEQKLQTGGGTLGGPMRFSKNELAVLWVQCDQETLDSRCDKRVDKMINEGMIKELEDFHKSFNEKRAYNDDIPDYTNGIFQSIGFKEFHEYLTYNNTDDKHNKNKLYEKGNIIRISMRGEGVVDFGECWVAS
jgi:tRNA dimethylallyltransferase